jgi:hypothetical protein
MFGGQDDNAVPQNGGGASQQEEPLNGVSDLLGGSTPASDNPTTGFMPTPSEPPQSSVPAPQEEAEDVAPSPTPQAPAATDNGDLMDLKQQALQQLSPLVSHLDQSPEEKFRTTMMLIQASDNQALLKEAFEAAQTIEDDKARAQALLDVINEINYFTQNKQQS